MLETRDQGGDSPPARLGRGGGWHRPGFRRGSGQGPAPCTSGPVHPVPWRPGCRLGREPPSFPMALACSPPGLRQPGCGPQLCIPQQDPPESPWSLCWFASSPVVREWGGNVTAPGTSVPGESYLHPRETEPSAGTASQRRGRLHPHSCCLGKSWRPRPGGQPPARPWTAVVCCGHGGCGGGPVACGQAAGVTAASACL